MSKSQWFFVIILIIAVGAGVFLLKDNLATTNTVTVGGTKTVTSAADNEYQAVFLVNNQVYFGKLSDQDSQYPVLRDIYYLQVSQQIQPVQDGKAATQPVNNVSLIKLGGEIHGPTDEMRINRDQILLIENLRTDSNVVKAIKEYVANNAAAKTAPAAAPKP